MFCHAPKQHSVCRSYYPRSVQLLIRERHRVRENSLLGDQINLCLGFLGAAITSSSVLLQSVMFGSLAPKATLFLTRCILHTPYSILHQHLPVGQAYSIPMLSLHTPLFAVFTDQTQPSVSAAAADIICRY